MDKVKRCSGIVFIHFTIWGFNNLKINVFGAKILFWCIFIKIKCKCLQTGPGDLQTQTF